LMEIYTLVPTLIALLDVSCLFVFRVFSMLTDFVR
jgi:hypothetical protein